MRETTDTELCSDVVEQICVYNPTMYNDLSGMTRRKDMILS